MRISYEGGVDPQWSADGQELFYLYENGMMSVSVEFTDGTLNPGTPESLFTWPSAAFMNDDNDYDVSKDGESFLMKELREEDMRRPEIRFVSGWFEELERQVPHAEAN